MNSTITLDHLHPKECYEKIAVPTCRQLVEMHVSYAFVKDSTARLATLYEELAAVEACLPLAEEEAIVP